MSEPQERVIQNPTRHIATWGLIGFVAPILPLWLFFEARVEKRVRQEVKVQSLESRHKALETEMDDLKKDTEGRLWTMEGKIDQFLLNQAQTPKNQ